MDKQELPALADRCEQATGPDRELDAAIYIAAVFPYWRLQVDCEPFPEEVQAGRIQDPESFGWRESPRYTTSLDAAMMLVPDGWDWNCGFSNHVPHQAGVWRPIGQRDKGYFEGHSDHFRALALCAASLRARTAQLKDSPNAG